MEYVERHLLPADARFDGGDLDCGNCLLLLIRHHLDECSPCLREYGIEQEVKALVARCCGSDKAPMELRERLRLKIAQFVLEADSRELLAE